MTLPDGGVGIIRECERRTGTVGATYTPMRLDPESESTQPLAGPIRGVIPDFSVNSEDGTIVATYRATACESLMRIRAGEASPLDLRIEEGDVSWNTQTGVPADGNDCYDEGLASSPSWSPDGSQLALWASVSVIGTSGLNRFGSLGGIYLADRGSPQATLLVRDVSGLSSITCLLQEIALRSELIQPKAQVRG
jgi:hypothetical protein